MQRVARLLAAGTCGEGYVDFEFADWQRSANIRQKIRLAAAPLGTSDRGSPRLILSSHDFDARPQDPAAIFAAMAAQQDLAAVKLAWRAGNILDNFVALDLLRNSTVPTIALCMGEDGLLSRVLARKFGAFASYCATLPGEETAPGQLSLSEMLDLYRWRALGPSTRLYGVVGDPVAHSLSPVLFNALFARHGIDAVYLPLRIDARGEVLGGFLGGCLERPWLDVGGFSVTVPHKEAAAAFVGKQIDPLASRIGAVNTLVPQPGGGFSGSNTDYAGALAAITEALGRDRQDLAGLRVHVLGAGGVARAIVAGLRDCPDGPRIPITIYNRTQARAETLAKEFGCRCEPWDRRAERTDADLLINCTSLGMWPAVDQTPMPAGRFVEDLVVFDAVYNPARTRLLGEAQSAGCRTIDGVTMFIHQAAAQFALWTGQKPDEAFMRTTVEAQLK
jgi:3-dehydroquinate dehydratase/shikimate dehydrogenase